jgi:type II secretory pathway component GspD/PulD (secretin)
MKPTIFLAWACALGLLSSAVAQPAPPADEEFPQNQETEEQATPQEEALPPGDARDNGEPQAPPPGDNWGSEPRPAPAVSPRESRGSQSPAPFPRRSGPPRQEIPPSAAGDGEAGLRLNFRGAPLDMVLDYLSDAAGFIINIETDIRDARVDVWSNQPLTREEGIQLLDTVLKTHGYAAIRNGRTLTIVSLADAKKRDVPVMAGGDPDEIPRTDRVVTQVIPVKFINATQLVKDLEPLLPNTATLSANEGGNALVITDTQSSIRRMAEIVEALDTAISSVSAVRVFPLRYADAKALATMVTSLFQTQDASRNNQAGPGRVFAQFRRDNQGGGNAAATPNGRAPVPRVTAVAEERSNSLVVSAPTEQMAVIAEIVAEVDTNVDDITELRVFRLRHADPQETADLLNNLFEEATGQQNNRGGNRFRFGNGGRNNTAEQSARMLAQTRVTAVPDLRTRSVVVSASRDLMEQIDNMIDQLDSDPARKQKVFVYSVENTDPQAVQEVLQTLFPEQNVGLNRNRRTTQRNAESALNRRQTQSRNNARNTGNTLGGNALRGNTLGGN